MTLRERLADQGRKVLNNSLVLKWSTDDRVKRAAEGIFDIRSRAEEAWRILVNGHALPAIDPALDDSIGQTEEQFTWSRPVAAELKRSNGNGKPVVATQDAPGSHDMDESPKERGTIASLGGRDVFQKCIQFKAADNARKMGIYPYFRPLDFNDGPEAQINGRRVTMFGSNNCLGLTTHPYTNPFITSGVPPKSAMLRTSYMATHEKVHLDRAAREAFYKVGKKYSVI